MIYSICCSDWKLEGKRKPLFADEGKKSGDVMFDVCDWRLKVCNPTVSTPYVLYTRVDCVNPINCNLRSTQKSHWLRPVV
jgi:hypothetical protein